MSDTVPGPSSTAEFDYAHPDLSKLCIRFSFYTPVDKDLRALMTPEIPTLNIAQLLDTDAASAQDPAADIAAAQNFASQDHTSPTEEILSAPFAQMSVETQRAIVELLSSGRDLDTDS
jgi:hypothetical protein